MWGEAWDRTTSKAESLKVGGVSKGEVWLGSKEYVVGWWDRIGREMAWDVDKRAWGGQG